MEKILENLSEDNKKLVAVLVGFIDDTKNIFDIITKDLDKDKALILKKSYVTMLMTVIGVVNIETILGSILHIIKDENEDDE